MNKENQPCTPAGALNEADQSTGTAAAVEITNLPADQITWLDKQDILDWLHISARTLQSWRSSGLLAYSQLGKKIYYNKTDVNSMLLKLRRN